MKSLKKDEVTRMIPSIGMLIVISMITLFVGTVVASELVSFGPYQWTASLFASMGISKGFVVIVVVMMWGIGFVIACSLGSISVGFLVRDNAKIWGLCLALIVHGLTVFLTLKVHSDGPSPIPFALTRAIGTLLMIVLSCIASVYCGLLGGTIRSRLAKAG